MRTWLLHIGERLPVDHGAGCYRYGYLARAFANQGHQVLRWAPTFSHIEKRHRFAGDCRVEIERNYAIQFVQPPGYRSNVGLGRLVDYQFLGHRLRTLMAREAPPDLILAAIPSLEWAIAAIDFGRAHQVPVVIDIRDPWPDGLLQALPPVARLAGRFALAPYQRMATRICRSANALIGVSQSYLDWALMLAGRSQQAQDAVVPLGFEPDVVSPAALQKNVAALTERGIALDQPTCLFSGSFERSYDLETLVEAARRLSDIGRKNLQFVLCGDGSKRLALEHRADKLRLNNVHFLGEVDTTMLQAAASISSIGLCPFAFDATQGIPSQCFQYMAGRLAIVSSLPGELAVLLKHHECGLTYDAGSINALTNTVNRLLLNPQMLESLRNHGYEAWSQHYRSRTVCVQFADHLGSLVRVGQQAA